VLSGELGVSQAFLRRWYIDGGYMDVSEVVVFMYPTLFLIASDTTGMMQLKASKQDCVVDVLIRLDSRQ